MLVFDYKDASRSAVVTWDTQDESKTWLSSLKNMLSQGQRVKFTTVSSHSIVMPWWAFLALSSSLNAFVKGHSLEYGVDYSISAKAKNLLSNASESRQFYSRARDAEKVCVEDLLLKLHKVGFDRKLTPEQIRNVCVLASLPAGATFSVPGSGKTTEALASFAYRAESGDRLLVVSPKNAFAAWDEQLCLCFPNLGESFTRLRKTSAIPGDLLTKPRFMIIGYQQFVRVEELVCNFVANNRVHVFLDESHRIKAITSVSTAAILNLSYIATSKLIMSGTPMPQAISDLVPQVRFLFPEIKVMPENVVNIIKPMYVRTTKKELNLPEITYVRVPITMNPIQRHVYNLIRSEVVRSAQSYLSQKDRQTFRKLGRSVIRALQLSSNPALLSDQALLENSGAFSAMLNEGHGPKIEYLLNRVRQLAVDGRKVLIWTSFVKNVESIAYALQDIGSEYIHGGVDTGDIDDIETREGKIRKFHDDPETRVLVANPAAASEGISLHSVCHHAIYLDRTFNAAHYLQSLDRIHRIGLEKDIVTTVEILECSDSVDEAVQNRLEYKVAQMARVLEDPSLSISFTQFDIDEDGLEAEVSGLSEQDVEEVLRVMGIG